MGLSTAFKLSAMKPLTPRLQDSQMRMMRTSVSMSRVITPEDSDWNMAARIVNGNRLDKSTVQAPSVSLGLTGMATIGRLTSMVIPGSRGANG